MRAYTDAEIIAQVESLPSFKGWKKGLYEIWLRSKADQYDAFDDKGFTYYVANDGDTPEFLMARNGTTNAGSYGLKFFRLYNHLGCAVLKSNHIEYNSHQKGLHKGKDAYVQVKGFPYFRDNNRNERAEEFGPEYNDIIGANIHRAGVNSTVIKNWSTACIVTGTLSRFFEWWAACKSHGFAPVSLCILKEF